MIAIVHKYELQNIGIITYISLHFQMLALRISFSNTINVVGTSFFNPGYSNGIETWPWMRAHVPPLSVVSRV